MSGSTQLTLGLFSAPRATFTDYRGTSNLIAKRALAAWAVASGPWCVGLWGSRGTGRSHLLQAAIRVAHEAGRRAMYLPLAELRSHGAGILDGLAQMHALALDDLDLVAGDGAWEKALFTLYNDCHAAGASLAFAVRAAPANAGFALPDLTSRLTSALVFQLVDPLDGEKQQVLQEVADARGMELPEAVAGFLIRRLPRDMHALMAALDVLDRESLRASRALTIPFVRDTLRLAP
ncbi:MAG: DnaA regulatory inactivator Hda [Gammaproteobacteria bacterium]